MNEAFIPICVWTLAMLGCATPMLAMLDLDKPRLRTAIENAVSIPSNHPDVKPTTQDEFPGKQGKVL